MDDVPLTLELIDGHGPPTVAAHRIDDVFSSAGLTLAPESAAVYVVKMSS
jgi:hypothetical protein